MDDPLLCSPSLTHSQQHTTQFLNFLTDWGYWVSLTKVQLSLPRVTYLRVLLLPIKRYITTDRKSLISTLPLPTSKAESLSFLELAGYLCLWIPNFTILAQPLYQATRGGLSETLELKSNIRSAFNTLKQAILSAPALALSGLSCPLYSTERHKIAQGILAPALPLSFIYQSNEIPQFKDGWPAFVLWQQLRSSLRKVKNRLLEHPLSFVHHMALRTYFLTNPWPFCLLHTSN